MKCPVCPARDIPDNSLSCPLCRTDLTAIQRVRQLHLVEYNEAVRLADCGSIDLALDHALASLAMDERFVPGMILVGRLLWRKKRFAEAISRWRQAESVAPDNGEARDLIAAGQAFLKRRRMKRGLTISILGAAAVLFVYLLPISAFRQIDGTTSDLAERIRSLSEKQGQILSGMQSHDAYLRDLAGLVEDMRVELVEQASDATARFDWARATVDGVVESLRPVKMQALREKIVKLENELVEARIFEERFQYRGDLSMFVMQLVAKERVREREASLRLLLEEWRRDIAPWIEVKERVDAAFSCSGQDQGQ